MCTTGEEPEVISGGSLSLYGTDKFVRMPMLISPRGSFLFCVISLWFVGTKDKRASCFRYDKPPSQLES